MGRSRGHGAIDAFRIITYLSSVGSCKESCRSSRGSGRSDTIIGCAWRNGTSSQCTTFRGVAHCEPITLCGIGQGLAQSLPPPGTEMDDVPMSEDLSLSDHDDDSSEESDGGQREEPLGLIKGGRWGGCDCGGRGRGVVTALRGFSKVPEPWKEARSKTNEMVGEWLGKQTVAPHHRRDVLAQSDHKREDDSRERRTPSLLPATRPWQAISKLPATSPLPATWPLPAASPLPPAPTLLVPTERQQATHAPQLPQQRHDLTTRKTEALS
jgi:hypothetical protein